MPTEADRGVGGFVHADCRNDPPSYYIDLLPTSSVLRSKKAFFFILLSFILHMKMQLLLTLHPFSAVWYLQVYLRSLSNNRHAAFVYTAFVSAFVHHFSSYSGLNR